MSAEVKEKQMGIPCCINCIGMHPDEVVGLQEIYSRVFTDAKYIVHKKWKEYARKKKLYADMSCMLCGRTYLPNGELDTTWELTAKRVKMEFEALDIQVDDYQVRQIVATAQKAFKRLWRDRGILPKEYWDKLSFAGMVAFILTKAEEGKAKKDSLGVSKALGIAGQRLNIK